MTKVKMKMKMKIWRTERLIVIRCHALYGAASKCIIISKTAVRHRYPVLCNVAILLQP